MWRAALLLGLCTACVAVSPPPEDGFEVQVTHVQDGDSFVALRDGEEITVRLHGVDCPERDQAGASAARRFTATRAEGRRVWVVPRDRDAYGRTVGRVRVDRLDLNLALVEAGLCWHFARHSGDPALAEAERTARAERRGLWAEASPEPPWEFRRRAAAAPPATTPAVRKATVAAYLGNTRSRVFHRASCLNASCPSCTESFAARADATAAGYRPAACCRP